MLCKGSELQGCVLTRFATLHSLSARVDLPAGARVEFKLVNGNTHSVARSWANDSERPSDNIEIVAEGGMPEASGLLTDCRLAAFKQPPSLLRSQSPLTTLCWMWKWATDCLHHRAPLRLASQRLLRDPHLNAQV
jgi:hypothetical protein